jgi:CRISPR/Cas system CMR subunit Cmr4 (Cas7 group RAMP superfamily)
MITFFIASNKDLTWRSPLFMSFGQLIEFPLLLMFRNGQHRIWHFHEYCYAQFHWEYYFNESEEDIERVGDTHGQRASSQFEVISRVCQGRQRRTVAAFVYSPEISPNSSFLFGHKKEKMSDYNRASQPDLLKTTTESLSQINKTMLICVFEFWMTQLQWGIKHEGKCWFK